LTVTLTSPYIKAAVLPRGRNFGRKSQGGRKYILEKMFTFITKKYVKVLKVRQLFSTYNLYCKSLEKMVLYS
jgi:hypothetical protein